MKAIIMAGGEGSRLRPLTCDCPKPMLPLMGKPLMEYAVQLLRRHGVSDIAATLGYLPEAISDYFGDGGSFHVNMRFYTEKTPLGTAGSVLQARDFLDERFIVLSGDGITDFDLTAALRFHEERKSLATLLLKKCAHPQEYGMVVTDADGRILSFHEKPGRSDIYSDLINTGVYILEKEVLDFIPEGKPYDFGHDLFPALLDMGLPAYGYAAEGYWCDVGDVAAYLQVHFDALDGRIDLPGLEANAPSLSGCRMEGPAYVHPDAAIEEGAHIGPYSIIGGGCRVAAGAGVKRSLLLQGARIEAGAQLRGCICAKGSSIGADAQLFEESVVGSFSRIGERCVLAPGIKVWPGKCIPDGEHPGSNIVWGSRMEERFVSGALMLTEPGQAARCVQACLAEMHARDVVIGRENSSVADALFHAAVSGAMAQGLQVIDAGVCSLPQLRHALHGMHAGCALLVKDDRLVPLDANGCPLPEKQQRSVLKLLQRQDYACPFSHATLPLISLGNTKSAYVADVAAAFAGDAQPAPLLALDIRDEMGAVTADILARSGIAFRCEGHPDALRPGPGELGISFRNDGEDIHICDESGPLSDVELQLARAWTAMQLGEAQLVLPLHFTRAIGEICVNAVYMPGERAVWMNALQQHSRLQFRLHADGPYFLMRFLSMLVRNGLSLHQWRCSMPTAYRRQTQIDLPMQEGGVLLHRLAQDERQAQLGGGMRLDNDRGWAWFSPDGGRLELFAEAASMEAAEELCAFYEGKIRRLLDNRD